jgi:HAD superfamily hydrolase (TIGR01509 family)
MRLPRVPLAVVFDMDGLLLDTETLYEQAIGLAAAECGLEAIPAALFRRMIGNPWTRNRTILLEHCRSDAAVDALRAAWLACFERIAEGRLALKPGAAELLEMLAARGIPRAIATSSQPQAAARHLALHGLGDAFQAVVAAGDYAAGKPAPDPFLRAAERLGVSPAACLALEDSHNGVRSAAAAGMMTVMVPDLLEPTEEIAALALLVLPDLHAVRRLLLDSLPQP